MFKRLFWLMVGAGFGFGVSFWLMRFVKAKAARYTPERVTSDLADAVRGFGQDLRAAVAEGRAAMQEREVELRADAERVRAGETAVDRRDHDDPPAPPPAPAARPARALPAAWGQPSGKLARQLVDRLSRN